MSNLQQRIRTLEKTHKAKGGKPEKIIVMYDALGDGLATFGGEKMTQAEAEKKAAAQPDNVVVLRVCYASQAIKDGDE